MAKKLSAIALSKQSPRLPIETKSPASRSAAEGQAGVLASLVGVMDDALRWSASPDRHVDGVDDQFAAEVIGHRPADNAPPVDVQHDR